jgi:hypothetical protein
MDIEVCGEETIVTLQTKVVYDILPCVSCSTTTDKSESDLRALFSVNSPNCIIEEFTLDAPPTLANIVGYSASSAGSLEILKNYTVGQYTYTLTARTKGNVVATIPVQIDLCGRIEAEVVPSADREFVLNITGPGGAEHSTNMVDWFTVKTEP